jgi:hypothetical protein
MSRRNSRSQVAVERLLDERRQYQDWIQKLEVPGAAGAPSPVVERVRADYQSRLDAVTGQLARHEGELEAALGEAELRRDQAAGQRTARQDALAEAVLRHEVGEYDDEKFATISGEHTAALAQLAEEIESADRDIARLEEVLALIARVLPEAAPPPGPSAPEVPPAPIVARAAPPAPAAASVPATPPAEAAIPGKGAALPGGLDELSFLRSVAGGAKGGSTGRAAVAAGAPASPAAEPPAVPDPVPSPAPEGARAPRVSRPVMPPVAATPPMAAPASVPAPPPAVPEPAPSPTPAGPPAPAPKAVPVPPSPQPVPAPEVPRERVPEPRPEPPAAARVEGAPGSGKVEAALPAPLQHLVPEVPPEAKPSGRVSKRASFSTQETEDETARKSLRCTECGTYNLPTEWYCEKCGAELSAF